LRITHHDTVGQRTRWDARLFGILQNLAELFEELAGAQPISRVLHEHGGLYKIHDLRSDGVKRMASLTDEAVHLIYCIQSFETVMKATLVAFVFEVALPLGGFDAHGMVFDWPLGAECNPSGSIAKNTADGKDVGF
jgi:hypothetical protein